MNTENKPEPNLAEHLSHGLALRGLEPPRVTGTQQPGQLGLAGLVEAHMGPGQQTSRPVQRVVLSATMSERFVLDPTPALVELVVR